MNKYKLICVGGKALAIPTDKELRRAYMYYRGCTYIIAPESLPVRNTRFIGKVIPIPDSCIKLVDEIASKYKTKNFIIIVDTRWGQNEVKLFTPEIAKKDIDPDEVLYGPGEIMRKSHPIEDRYFDLSLFSVGRTNGPTSRVTFDEIYDKYRYRFDVNSRIEVSTVDSKDGFVLTFTFKSEKMRNMAKVVLPNKQSIVIMQHEFDLWSLGLLILTKQIQNLTSKVDNLFELAMEKWMKFNKPKYE